MCPWKAGLIQELSAPAQSSHRRFKVRQEIKTHSFWGATATAGSTPGCSVSNLPRPHEGDGKQDLGDPCLLLSPRSRDTLLEQMQQCVATVASRHSTKYTAGTGTYPGTSTRSAPQRELKHSSERTGTGYIKDHLSLPPTPGRQNPTQSWESHEGLATTWAAKWRLWSSRAGQELGADWTLDAGGEGALGGEAVLTAAQQGLRPSRGSPGCQGRDDSSTGVGAPCSPSRCQADDPEAADNQVHASQMEPVQMSSK